MSASFVRIASRAIIALLFTSTLINAQSAKCEHPKILSALKANYDNGSDIFCRELLATVSMIGTLREDPTLFYYKTVTNTKSTDTVYAYAATTTKERVTSTSYESQKRSPTSFVRPLPSYVQQYATPSPGAKTVTFTDTITKTKLKYATAPYPSTCPEADGIDYVATDRSQWERGCKTYLNCYRPLDVVKAPTLNACIEKCVEYNAKLGYKQCQAVTYNSKVNECQRVNEPCYFAHPDGDVNVATMRFLPPQNTPGSDYCATVSGAIPLGTAA